MRTRLLTTAAIAAAVVVLGLTASPPRPSSAAGVNDPDLQQRTVPGAFHVHSTRSDGSGTREEVAAAASRAGLRFVVFTDHGDATRDPEPPRYANGVLCLDAVEISTDGGHYVAVGLPKAPYRLGGEAAGVVADVARLGGFGFVAHPDSPKPELAWRNWALRADGVEWLNADTAWREASWGLLGKTLVGYLTRPAPALAGVLARPTATLARWDAQARSRRMPAVAGHDAHGGRLGSSYLSSFESFTTRAVLRAPPGGDALSDGALLVDAFREGRTYTVVDGMARGGWLSLRAERQGRAAGMGERLDGDGPFRLSARAPALPGARLTVLRNGAVVSETEGSELSVELSGPGAYRAEVRRSGLPSAAPWILGNPIYLDLPPGPAPEVGPDPGPAGSLGPGEWRTEHDPSSTAGLSVAGGRPELTFRLGAHAASPFAALVAPVPQQAVPFDRVRLDAVSDSPMRVSVQFRSKDGSARWRKSVYVAAEGGPTWFATADMAPVAPDAGPFNPAAAASVLLVVDLVNALPGTSGRLLVRDLSLAPAR